MERLPPRFTVVWLRPLLGTTELLSRRVNDTRMDPLSFAPEKETLCVAVRPLRKSSLMVVDSGIGENACILPSHHFTEVPSNLGPQLSLGSPLIYGSV